MRRGVGKRKPNARDVAATVKRLDRRHEVLALTVDGLSSRAVAAQLGISHTQVQRDLKLALGDRAEETSQQSRVLAKERIEAIIAANMPTARGEMSLMRLDSGKLVLSAIALDAKINGYEAPKHINLGGQVTLAPMIFIPAEQPRTHVNGSNGAGAASAGLASELRPTNGVPSPDDG